MSSNFLQRFKGKTQTISKDGVHDILGGGQTGGGSTKVFTHSNGIPMNQKGNTSKASNMNPSKNHIQQPKRKIQTVARTSVNKDNRKNKQTNYISQKQPQIKDENPFLISNPFYLDQEQKERQEKERKEEEKQQKMQQLQLKKQKEKEDPKKGTYASSMNARGGSVTKKTEKEWVKLGGLGPNLGGEQWQQKRKKQQKMQQFANQVKSINTSKQQVPPKQMPVKKQYPKDNPRNKALQYSKNVPKPIIRSYQKQQQEAETVPIKQINQNQLSQLQLYDLRHKQLQEMLRNQM